MTKDELIAQMAEALAGAKETITNLYRVAAPAGNYGNGQSRFADSDVALKKIETALRAHATTLGD